VRRKPARWKAIAAGLLAVCAAATASGQESETEKRTPDPTVVQWLTEAPRHDIPARMAVSPARLSFEQRQTLMVRVTLPARELQKPSAHRDLYVVVKAGDGSRWLPHGSYSRYEITRELDKKQEIEFVCTVYVRPGRWVLGVVVYDDVLKQRTVLRKTVDVPRIKNDPLPRLEAGLPEVEFLKSEGIDAPQAMHSARGDAGRVLREGGYSAERRADGAGRSRRPGEMPRVAGASGDMTNVPRSRESPGTEAPPEAMTDTPREVPVDVKLPVELDVLVDFTPSVQYSGSNRMLHWTASTFWAMTRVLTDLRSANLCTRVTGIDVLGHRVLFQKMNGSEMDWAKVAEELGKLDANTVNVETLERRKETANFFRSQVDDLLLSDSASCGFATQPEHVYVIAASGILFPQGTSSKPIEGRPTHLYYLRANLLWSDQWDAMEKIVKPLHPRLFSINDATQFRKALAAMVGDLEGTSPR
jgi:hypothetical protein